MTKKDLGRIWRYEHAKGKELRDVYTSWSDKKEAAYKYCKNLKVEKDGYDFRICSANGWQFSAGFKFKDENGKECLMYITKSENAIIRLED